MIKLLVKFDGDSKEVEFNDPEITIGRATDNTLPIPDKKSSRKHAKIEKVNGEYLVNDLGSGNGTKVNGKDVNTHVLSKGDEIAIGLTTISVLALDTPVGRVAAPPPPPAAVPAAVAHAPLPPLPNLPPPSTARLSSESVEEARRKATRRALARSGGSGWVGTAASIIVLIGIAAGGYYLYDKHEKKTAEESAAKAAKELESTAKFRDAKAAYDKFAKSADKDPVEDSMIAEAMALAETHGKDYPQWDSLVASLKQRRNDQIGRDDFATVDGRIQSALRDRRFSDALQALKDLKANTDPTAAGGLVAKVCDTINSDFKAVDDRGRKLADEKKWTIAADHYKLEAPRFKGTEHYRYLLYKPETLEQLKKAEAETAAAKGRPVEPDTAIAKAEPKPEPKPEPVMPKPEPKPEPVMPKPEPKPEMKPEMKPEPKPEMMKKPEPKPEPKKPEPKPEPKPEMKPEPKPEPKPVEPGQPFKKPDVLCDCKKIVKGVYCIKCDRMLATEDMRNGVCKRCEEKPKKIDLCSKKFYMVDGQPDKRSEKPILFEGKLYDFAYEDKARIVWHCDGCQEQGDAQGEVKHKPDCASKNVIKVCTKSGTPPHGGEKK